MSDMYSIGVAMVYEILLDKIIENPAKKKNIELCMQTVMKLLGEFKLIPKETYSEKSSQISLNARNEANRIFLTASKKDSKDFIKAHETYTKSAAFAPNGEDLALSYANRSQVLFGLEKYEDCIKDIDRALGLCYPDHLIIILLLRKVECLALINSSLLDEVYEECEIWIEEKMKANEQVKYKLKLKNSYVRKFEKSTQEKISEINPIDLMRDAFQSDYQT